MLTFKLAQLSRVVGVRAAVTTPLRAQRFCLAPLRPSISVFQHQCFSSAADTSTTDNASTGDKLIFEGPKAKILRVLKLASVANVTASGMASPLLMGLAEASKSTSMSVMMALLMVFGGTTTVALHWVGRPYIKSLVVAACNKKLLVETIGLTGAYQITEVPLDVIGPPKTWHPFGSFEVDGRVFYIDPDGDLHDKEWVNKIVEQINSQIPG